MINLVALVLLCAYTTTHPMLAPLAPVIPELPEAIIQAVRQKNYAQVQAFLDQDPNNVNAMTHHTCTTLTMETIFYSDIAMFDLVMRYNPALNKRNISGKNELLYAAAFGTVHHIQTLLEHKADLTCIDIDGKNALETTYHYILYPYYNPTTLRANKFYLRQVMLASALHKDKSKRFVHSYKQSLAHTTLLPVLNTIVLDYAAEIPTVSSLLHVQQKEKHHKVLH